MGRLGRVLSFLKESRDGTNVTDVKLDRGGLDTRTVDHFSAPGDDSAPIIGDYVATLSQSGAGRDSAVGYLDPLNPPKAEMGDKRVYARDPALGTEVCQVHLKNDGSIEISNGIASLTIGATGTVSISTGIANLALSALGAITGTNGVGGFALDPSGVFTVNKVAIDPAGNITTPGNITGAVITGTVVNAPITNSPTINGVTITGTTISGTTVTAGVVSLSTHIHPQLPDSAGDTQFNTGAPI